MTVTGNRLRRSLGWSWGLGVALILAVAAGVHAQGLSLKHDSSLPIEITADRLEVAQADQVATFSGKVDAVQGDLVLSADRLKVYYGNKQDGAPTPTLAGGSIRRIEAEGNVFLSSPRETAQGETGVYDVAGNQMTLEGSVVLTQGDNVVRGDRLEVDLASGQSRVLAAVPASEGGSAPQRVRALFTPQAKAPNPAPAADGAKAEPGPAAKSKGTE